MIGLSQGRAHVSVGLGLVKVGIVLLQVQENAL